MAGTSAAGTSAAASAGADFNGMGVDGKIKVMVAMKQTNINGQLATSYSSGEAFDWIHRKITNCFGGPAFKLYIIHVQVHKPRIRIPIPWPRSNSYSDWDTDTDQESLSDGSFVSYWSSSWSTSSSSKSDEWSEEDKRRGEAFLTSFATRCTENRIEYVPILKRGSPKKEICAAVEEVKPDLLVLGNRGLGGFRRLFVTSVNEYCAKHAECAILTIKPNVTLILSNFGH